MSFIGKINDYKIKKANISSYKQYTTDEILSYINGFNEPIDFQERSYYQYKCNSKLYGITPPINFFRNLLCFFPFWILIIRRGNAEFDKEIKNVFISDEHKMDIIPQKYKNSFTKLSRTQGWFIEKKDRKFIFDLWSKHPFSYYFLLKNVIKIANYKWAIEKYNPENILCTCEFSFTSSILTEYCHQYNIVLYQ